MVPKPCANSVPLENESCNQKESADNISKLSELSSWNVWPGFHKNNPQIEFFPKP